MEKLKSPKTYHGHAGSHNENFYGETTLLKAFSVLGLALIILGFACGIARAADLIFMSTQLNPIEQAQQARDVLLKESSSKIEFLPCDSTQLTARLRGEQQGGHHTISLIGALQGELQPLVAGDFLIPLDDLAARLADHGIPKRLMRAGRFGSRHQWYVPWMQASYIMIANKKALPYLPPGADINALSYEQLSAWGSNLLANTGKRLIGFPAGQTGRMHRFLQGYLYPSYTGGLVTTFSSPDAVAMWSQFRELWKSVNPNSVGYDLMSKPLLAGEVWVGFDHVSVLAVVLDQKPDEYVAFPAPGGPKGRGFMPIVAGLAIAKHAPDPAGAAAAIEYLLQPGKQVATNFLPVLKSDLSSDSNIGLRLLTDAVFRGQTAPDAIISLLPVGLGEQDNQFNQVILDTFKLIVLEGQAPRDVLNRQAVKLQRVLEEAQAHCWSPDPSSQGTCRVK
jgi:multiple sugar transport system substrate-binding protein